MRLHGKTPVPILIDTQHNWLGLMWPDSLDLGVVMEGRIKAASAKLSPILGMVAGGILPLGLALDLFEAIVEGTLRFGRWLYGAESRLYPALDTQLQSWSRLILGASS